MRFFDQLLNRAGRDPDQQGRLPRIPTQEDVRARVHDAPANFNRRTRRAYGSPFRWLGPIAMGNARQAPRYARRHGVRVLSKSEQPGTRTRRERKEAAHVARLVARGAL